MKFFLMLILSLCCLHITVAQTKKISGKIAYAYDLRQSLYIPGAGDKHDTTWLYFNDTLSTYVIDTKPVDPKKIADQLKGLNAGTEELRRLTDQITDNYNERRFQYSYRRNGTAEYYRPWQTGNQRYCRVDSLADFNWELTTDTMRILGFLCQKATSDKVWEDGYYRKFVVWYTPEIPIAFGPKNIFGLPGVVLKAESKYHRYTAVQIRIPLPAEETVQLSKCNNLPRISASQADKMNAKAREDVMNMQKLRANP